MAPPAEADLPREASVVVLDTYGIWRMHCTLEPPALPTGETVKVKHEWMNYKTPGPADGWTTPGFDDRTWFRGPLTLACKTPLLARACLRGKFMVTDPRAVKGLKLSATYRGGLIVTVNGKEVCRKHLAPGAALAEGPVGEKRTLETLSIPKRLLRRGVNVIGLELLRAPHAKEEAYYIENGCEIFQVRLVSSGEAGLLPNVARPKGFQVWNADVMATDFTLDYGGPCESRLLGMKIVGARNGKFSGKLLVGSTEPIRGLKTTPSLLRGKGGVIPASNVHIRYGALWGLQRFGREKVEPYATWANRLGALVEQVPQEVAVMVPKKWSWFGFPHKPGFTSVSGAVVPVWLTVEVPAKTKPGTYTGSVTIKAHQEQPRKVPVELQVADYTLPDTRDYRTFVDIIQCPDTLALEYSVPLWSDEHFKMIANSFKLIGQTGSRTVYIPLIARTNLGNEESMVRWTKKGDKYDYDFSIMERYLSVAEKNMGKPKVIVLVVWDTYMMPTKDVTEAKRYSRQKQMATFLTEKQGATLGHGPRVTVLDAKTGRTENVYLPTHFEREASKALWKPLLSEVRRRLTRRGLEKAMMMGLMSDAWPKEEELALFDELTGGAPWVIQSHAGLSKGRKIYGKYVVGYQTAVWSVSYSDDNGHRPKGYRGGVESHRGWARPDLKAAFDRSNGRDQWNATARWRHRAEVQITGGQRGQGRLGGDYWKVIRNKRGWRVGRTHERYPESHWRQLCITTSLLAPGPDGPVASDLMEAFREGVQECEARIVLERALGDEALRAKLGADLTRRCKEYLYARHMMMWLALSNHQLHGSTKQPGKWRSKWTGYNLSGTYWFLSSDWQKRTAKLFDLAGEVTRKLNGK